MHKRPKPKQFNSQPSSPTCGGGLPHIGSGLDEEFDSRNARSTSRAGARPTSSSTPGILTDDQRAARRCSGSAAWMSQRSTPSVSPSATFDSFSFSSPEAKPLPSLSNRSTACPSVSPSAASSQMPSRRPSSSAQSYTNADVQPRRPSSSAQMQSFYDGQPRRPSSSTRSQGLYDGQFQLTGSCPAPPPLETLRFNTSVQEPARSRRVVGSSCNVFSNSASVLPETSTLPVASGNASASLGTSVSGLRTRPRSLSSLGPSSGATTPDYSAPPSRASSRGSRTPTGERHGGNGRSGNLEQGRPGMLAGLGNRDGPGAEDGIRAPMAFSSWSGTKSNDAAASASSLLPLSSVTPAALGGVGKKGSMKHRTLTYTEGVTASDHGDIAGGKLLAHFRDFQRRNTEPAQESTRLESPAYPEFIPPGSDASSRSESLAFPELAFQSRGVPTVSWRGSDRRSAQNTHDNPAADTDSNSVNLGVEKELPAQLSSSPESSPAKACGFGHFSSTPCGPSSSSRAASNASSANAAFGTSKQTRNSHSWHPSQMLSKGSRDDSFLSTISESTTTRSSDSMSTDDRQSRNSKLTVFDGSQIEVFSEMQGADRINATVVKDFHELFSQEGEKYAEDMCQQLRQYGFDKPLEMQRRVIPLVKSAFSEDQKSFITVQGGKQCGKTSALVLGILAAVGAEAPGIRAVCLSTTGARDFKRYFDIVSDIHPLKLECLGCTQRRVCFEGLAMDPESALAGFDPLEDLQRISQAQDTGAPVIVFGHPSRVLPLLREAPSWGVDLCNIQVLVLDDAEETVCLGLMEEVCEVCTILRHFSKHRLRHILLSRFLSHQAQSMIRCLRTSMLRQQNLFGIRAHKTEARAKGARHYFAVAPRSRWPNMLAVLHHALALPSGIIFDDASPENRAQACSSLRTLGIAASVWNALAEQSSGARAAARDAASGARLGPAFHLMPSDLVVLKVDLPQVRCVLHFEVPRRELTVYGLRLMCLEHQEQKKTKTTKASSGAGDGRGLSVLFVEEADVVRDLEKTFRIKMQEVPAEILHAG